MIGSSSHKNCIESVACIHNITTCAHNVSTCTLFFDYYVIYINYYTYNIVVKYKVTV